MNSVESHRRLAKISEAAEFLNVTTRTIHTWISDGTIASTKIGGVRRIPWTVLRKMAAPDRR